MFTHASRHDHDSNEGDDQATRMLSLSPDARAQAWPIQPPRMADASPTDAEVISSPPQAIADVVAVDTIEVAITQPSAARDRADVTIMAIVEPIALKLLAQERHQRLIIILAAVLSAREEHEAPYHRAASPAPNVRPLPGAKSERLS